MRSPEGRWRNCIIYLKIKEDFVKGKMTEKILGKINCYEFVKSVAYKFQPNLVI